MKPTLHALCQLLLVSLRVRRPLPTQPPREPVLLPRQGEALTAPGNACMPVDAAACGTEGGRDAVPPPVFHKWQSGVLRPGAQTHRHHLNEWLSSRPREHHPSLWRAAHPHDKKGNVR